MTGASSTPDTCPVRLDATDPARIRSNAGVWSIDGSGLAVLGTDGVTTTPGTFAPTDTCDAGMADKLSIPVGYLRRLRSEHLGLYDANVNGWLEHQPGLRLLIRALRGDEGGGIARAVLSERYRFVDNLDVLLAVLDGIRGAGADVEIRRCDLTERRMYVQIASQSVAAQADVLLVDYVRPSAAPTVRTTRWCSPGSCCPTARPGTARSRSRCG